MPWLLHDPIAHGLVIGAVVAISLGDIAASCVGMARDGTAGGVLDSLFSFRRGPGVRQDRWTKWIIVLGADGGLLAAILIAALVPSLRAGADTWWTLGLGVAVVLAGISLRAWAIVSLGRYFQRVVTIEPGQTIVRRGPYRALRHPSYTGLLISIAGLGLALGSWVGAAVALGMAFAGMLPRIHVEEHALARAFGTDYEDYARSTDRLIPHIF